MTTAQKRRMYKARWMSAYRNKDRAAFNARNREYYRRSKKISAARAKRYYEKERASNRPQMIVRMIRNRSKKNNIAFDLTRQWLKKRLDRGVCELTGLSFDMAGRRTPHSPSIDKIDPSKGYTKKNCRVILWSLNQALGNRGLEYMKMLFSKIK